MSSFVTKCTRSAPASDTENLIRESLDSIDSATCVHSHINAPYLQEFWCQRRDSNSQTPVSKTGRYSNSRTLAHLYEGYAAKTHGLRPSPIARPARRSNWFTWRPGEDFCPSTRKTRVSRTLVDAAAHASSATGLVN